MKHWCNKCGKYTEFENIKFHSDGHRDMGDGSIADVRTIKCKVCGGEMRVDFAPDRR